MQSITAEAGLPDAQASSRLPSQDHHRLVDSGPQNRKVQRKLIAAESS